jgi:hypothetical protein
MKNLKSAFVVVANMWKKPFIEYLVQVLWFERNRCQNAPSFSMSQKEALTIFSLKSDFKAYFTYKTSHFIERKFTNSDLYMYYCICHERKEYVPFTWRKCYSILLLKLPGQPTIEIHEFEVEREFHYWKHLSVRSVWSLLILCNCDITCDHIFFNENSILAPIPFKPKNLY